MLAVEGWRSAPGEADEARAAAAAVDLEGTATWLEARAKNGFSTPWYGAVNLSALCALGRGDSIAAAALARQLCTLDPDNEQVWSKRGHHAAQILEALGRYGEDREVLRRWRDAVLRELDSDNDMYVAGQMVHALLGDGVSATDLETTVRQLCDYLAKQPLSKQSFMGYVAALQALSTIRSAAPDEVGQLVSEKTTELVKKYAETAWYNDPELPGPFWSSASRRGLSRSPST